MVILSDSAMYNWEYKRYSQFPTASQSHPHSLPTPTKSTPPWRETLPTATPQARPQTFPPPSKRNQQIEFSPCPIVPLHPIPKLCNSSLYISRPSPNEKSGLWCRERHIMIRSETIVSTHRNPFQRRGVWTDIEMENLFRDSNECL